MAGQQLTQADVQRLLNVVPQERLPEFLSNLYALLNIKDGTGVGKPSDSVPESKSAPANETSAPVSAAAVPVPAIPVSVPALAFDRMSTLKKTKEKQTVASAGRAGMRKKNAPRRSWSQELHRHFVIAWQTISESGVQPSPKKIMIVMGQNGAPMADLTIRQVQSHHQKYKLKLQRQKEAQGADGTPALNSRSLAESSMGWSLTPSTSMESTGSEFSEDDVDGDGYGLGGALCGSMSIESTGSDVGDWVTTDPSDAWGLASVSASSSTSSPDMHADAGLSDWTATLGLDSHLFPPAVEPLSSVETAAGGQGGLKAGDVLTFDLRSFGLAGLRNSSALTDSGILAAVNRAVAAAAASSEPVLACEGEGRPGSLVDSATRELGSAPVPPLFSSGQLQSLRLSNPLFNSDTMKMFESSPLLNSGNMSWSPMLSLKNSLSTMPLDDAGTASLPADIQKRLDAAFDPSDTSAAPG